MAQQTINNGESGSSVRTKLNAMFTELYPKKVSITSSGTAIVFTTPVPIDTPFEVFPVSCMFAGQSVGVYFEDITRFGFTAYSAEPSATLLYNVLTFPE